jgi:hypothetical protein
MPVFTDDEISGKKSLILGDLGEPPDGTGYLEQIDIAGKSNIDKVWDRESVRAGSNLELAALFVKKACINLIIGSIWRGNYVPVGIVQSKDLSNMVKFWQDERKAVQEQIDNMPSIGRINLDIYEPDWDEFQTGS